MHVLPIELAFSSTRFYSKIKSI